MKKAFGEAALGLQHVLAMYAGAILVPLIVGAALGLTPEQLTYLVSIDILLCGVATLLQVFNSRFFGIGLPVVLGCTFTAVGPMIAIGGQYGISAIYGSILVSGLFVIVVSGFFGSLVRFFPPVVTGSVVTIIGITLIPVAINNMGGGQGAADFGSLSNIALAFGTLGFIIFLYKFSRGFMRAVSILVGLIAGTVVAGFMGRVDFTPIAEASYFHMVEPFYFGMPTFEWSAILTMILVALVSLVESTGVYFALSDITKKEIKEKDLAKGYRSEGLAIFLGGIFNAFPYTAYSQNVGLIQMSGVKSRKIIFIAAIMLIVLGFVPKIGAMTTIIPTPVLGGAMIAMFGMVIAQGIKMLSGVISESQENSMIVACSVGIGLGVTVVPELFALLPAGVQILTSNGIVAGSLTAIGLNIVFHMLPSRKRKREAQAVQSNQAVTPHG
ncbi:MULTISPECIES: nucleobase:cation symporter-2 family protein [unclassified Planococcus (in: firmicutes)]|uniref:nucleobase:cation symporter-2 family protein n=1 Tax=Planococcus TaxID=1372 RepID=UPI000C31DA34|nr:MULTISPECIES: nucleobase:cation symporter-2 family protein [unclassified Planococcus (in: firmicutes)]AUD12770.1 xanthine permease [Planococcus sp. MB-3u-03]PKG47389.1 xanthine permease [Planococcus sp. Urea-trap-24]PKG88287.1 xanthine permease [Planococcus sp. Urea-3u-39]PKH36788.1 xanthine permease [Planococcus sp. MB-3u-09]